MSNISQSGMKFNKIKYKQSNMERWDMQFNNVKKEESNN